MSILRCFLISMPYHISYEIWYCNFLLDILIECLIIPQMYPPLPISSVFSAERDDHIRSLFKGNTSSETTCYDYDENG